MYQSVLLNWGVIPWASVQRRGLRLALDSVKKRDKMAISGFDSQDSLVT